MLATLLLAAGLSASPADLAFMQGNWEGRLGSLQLQERWTDAAGGLMLGVARNLKGEGAARRAVGFEFLRIEFRQDGSVVYVAQPQGRPPTEFRLTALETGSARFENPQHDHPKSIRYRLEGPDALVAELEGTEGTQRFRFQRAPSGER
ncbi:DUF6265 family protein [Inhella sp.]|uniref:DUF6265 family protein n=1 Tax=Inhella sp. TaxID=1921806 RepID=UPI0035AE45A4